MTKFLTLIAVILDATIRLQGPSRLNGTGRVEIFYSGHWGTICDDRWDINDARVACRQLGYRNALRALQGGQVSSGSGQIWLDEVGCTGNEQNLESCPHHYRGWGGNDCSHSEDAGVECTSQGKTIVTCFILAAQHCIPLNSSL